MRVKEGSRVKSRNLLQTAGCFSQRWGAQGWGEGGSFQAKMDSECARFEVNV